MVLSAALAGYPLAHAGDLTWLAASPAALGLVFVLLAAVSHFRFALVGALFLLGAEYVLLEATDKVPAWSVLIYAAGFVVLAEVLLWLAELPAPGRMDWAVLAGWLQKIILIAAASVVLALVAIMAGGLQFAGAITGTLAGSAAALVLLAAPWLLLKRKGGRTKPQA